MIDITANYRFYRLVSSTADPPSRPSATEYPPPDLLYDAGWDDTEPEYEENSTNSLYFVDCTVYSNNTCYYSEVSLSSSYEAAKAAYNKAVNAQNTANTAREDIDNLSIGARNLLRNSKGDVITDWAYAGTVEEDSEKGYCVVRSTTATSETFLGPPRTAKVEQSTQYTFSCDIYVNLYVSSVDFFWLSDTETNQKAGVGYANATCFKSKYKPTVEVWQRVWFTFTTKADDYTGFIRIDNNGSSASGSEAIMKVANLKLEKGNRPTDWTPAPEDVDEAVENAQKTADSVQNDIDNTKAYTHVATSVDGGDTLTYFDFSGYVESGTLSNGTETANASYVRSSEYIKVIPGNSYVWNVKNSSRKEVIPVTHFYSESSGSYTYLSSQTSNTITVPSGTNVFLRFTVAISSDEIDDSTYELTLSNLDSIIKSLSVNVYIGVYTTLNSKMSIDPEDYIWELTDTSTLKNATELAESLNTQLNGTDGTNGVIASLHTGIKETNDNIGVLDGKIGKINSFVVIDNDAPSITLVSTGDIQDPGNKVLITEDKISFYNGATEGAYIGYPDDDITNRTAMMASKTYVTEMYPRAEGAEANKWIGSLCWIARSNGHLSLKVVK